MAKHTPVLKVPDDLIENAIAEDVGAGDVTTAALIDPMLRAKGILVARESGVLAGMPVAMRLLRKFDAGAQPATAGKHAVPLRLTQALRDGSRLSPGTAIASITGPAASLLTVERTLLNFLQHLSGIATLTRKYVDAVAGTGVKVLDTRKTLPGWRVLAKYAVAVGGGTNHRMGLYDQVLIKDNHLGALRALGLGPDEAMALAFARLKHPRTMRVEIEVETVHDAYKAALMGADIVMLDNMRPAQMKKAVAAVRGVSGRTIIEASGRITLRNIRAVARTGVDWVSVGALTHSAPALDIALEIENL